jgi:hypothetical protein
MTDDNTQPRRTFTEEIEVAGHQLVTRVKELVAEGRVRTLRIKEPDGDMVVEMPLNVGVVAGGVVALAAPGLAVLGVLAGLVTRVRIEVVRDVEEVREAAEMCGAGRDRQRPVAVRQSCPWARLAPECSQWLSIPPRPFRTPSRPRPLSRFSASPFSSPGA